MSTAQIDKLAATLALRAARPDGTAPSLTTLRSIALTLAALPGPAARSACNAALSMLTTHYAGRHRYAARDAVMDFCRRAMAIPPAPLLPIKPRVLSTALHISLNRLYTLTGLDPAPVPFPDLQSLLVAARELPLDTRLVPTPAMEAPRLAAASDGAPDASTPAPDPIPIDVAVIVERLLILCHEHGIAKPTGMLSKLLGSLDHALVPKDHTPSPGIVFGLPDPVVRRAYALTFDPDADPTDPALGVPVPGRHDPHADVRVALGTVRRSARTRGRPGRPAAVQTPRAFWHHLANALGLHRSMRATLVSAAMQTWPAPANPDAPQLYAGTQLTSPVPDWFLWNNLRRLHTGLGLTRREFLERTRADTPVLRDMIREWAERQPAC